MAPGQELGVLPVAPQQLDGLVDRPGHLVLERRGDHSWPPFARWIVLHTVSGSPGRSISVTPRWDSASTTAFTTAGGEAMVPVSPTPLTPSSLLVDGVTWRPTVIDGTSGGPGT